MFLDVDLAIGSEMGIKKKIIGLLYFFEQPITFLISTIY